MAPAAPRPQPPAWLVPCLAIRSAVVFPRAVATLDIVRPENLAALAAHAGEDAPVVAVSLTDLADGPTRAEQVRRVGTLCRLLDRIRLPDGTERIVLQGLRRVTLARLDTGRDHVRAEVREVPPARSRRAAGETIERTMDLVARLVGADPRYSQELPGMLAQERGDAERFADLLASRLHLPYHEAAELNAQVALGRRLERLLELLATEVARADAARSLNDRVQERARQSFLREQLVAIRGELGETDPIELERRELAARIEGLQLPPAARKRLSRELAHLARAAPGSAEAGRLRSWIEWTLDLPWDRRSQPPEGTPEDFDAVLAALDISHTGLVEVKSRVTEFLAVQRLGGAARGTVLCFHGPPGTGKTSMARSVATALGREFVRVPVGGVDDEAELRGRRHTDPSAAPGRILQGLQRAGAKDPVVLLDEVDRILTGGGGEAGGVLLEILDPEQNAAFHDRYLGVPFDLSECIFLATANDVRGLSDALVDRLELIPFESYSESDKLAIAREHLVPRARDAAGVAREQLSLSRGALVEIVRKHTAEAGVRQLSRALDSLARKAALEVVRGRPGLAVRKADLPELLGPANPDEELHTGEPTVGVVTGLAWTTVGGSTLPVEALGMPGAGRSILTGSLGEVMRESVQTATSWVRSRLAALGLAEDVLESLDVHLHFPSGATPKDGPSAGLAIAVALVSLLTGVPVRHDVAMTGEISLHGAVLPVGGLREKLLAALRAGARIVVLPARNSEEVLRLPPEVRQRLDIRIVEDVGAALRIALLPERSGRGRGAAQAPGEGRERRRPRRRSAQ